MDSLAPTIDSETTYPVGEARHLEAHVRKGAIIDLAQ